MSATPADGKNDPEKRLHELFTQFFGDGGDAMLDQMRAQGADPAELFGGMGNLPTPDTINAALQRIRELIADGGDEAVNTQMAHDLARQAAVAGGDPVITVAQARDILNAFTAAELWLDVATELPPATGPKEAWSRSQWVEATLPTWQTIVAPIAGSMSNALATVLGSEVGAAEPDLDNLDFSELLGASSSGSELFGDMDNEALNRLGLGALNPAQLLRRIGSTAFGMQAGAAAGQLSREVFGTTDLGLPLWPGKGAALLPGNIAEFAKGLDIPEAEVRGYLAVREAAAARLFANVPWLRGHLSALVEKYAAGIDVNMDTLHEHMRDIDPMQPEQLQKMMAGGGMFNVPPTEDQKETLLNLETALALVEGWVDEVTTQATAPHLPNAPKLREMLRRRRAAGGPAEQAFANLVGLDLRPRRSRDAADLFAKVYAADGIDGRDGVWKHPDLLPTGADLDDPARYLKHEEAVSDADAEFDAALAALLADASLDNDTDNAEPSNE